MTSKITIIICSYNGGNRLPKVLDRLVAENKVEEYVREVIVINNCSTDNTEAVIKKYEQSELIIPIRYAYEERPGLSNARKKGIDLCTTEWIAFLDDDNLIEPGWIGAIAKYIAKHKCVGAFNGGVIPYIPVKMTEEEELNLKSSFKVLACTHISLYELQRNMRSPFSVPIGAGLVIRTAPLKELIANGWLNSSGRTGENLTSGEDSEMSLYIKNKGYSFGFCPHAVILHEIDCRRLNTDYLNKLWYQMGKGVSVAGRRYSKMIRFAYLGLLYIRLISYLFADRNKFAFYRRYIAGYRDEERNN